LVCSILRAVSIAFSLDVFDSLSRNYLPFDKAREEARKFANQYNLKTRDQWNEAVKKGIIPKYLPANPWQVYSKRKKK